MIKITLIFTKKSKKMFRYPNSRKTIIFARNKAKTFLKTYSIRLHVDYGNGFWNDMNIYTPSDLLWGVKAFVTEYRKEYE